MKKSDIDEMCLVKLRNGKICCLMRRDYDLRLYSKSENYIFDWESTLSSYNDCLYNISYGCEDYDIVAVSRLHAQSMSIEFILNGRKLPDEDWDWIRGDE